MTHRWWSSMRARCRMPESGSCIGAHVLARHELVRDGVADPVAPRGVLDAEAPRAVGRDPGLRVGLAFEGGAVRNGRRCRRGCRGRRDRAAASTWKADVPRPVDVEVEPRAEEVLVAARDDALADRQRVRRALRARSSPRCARRRSASPRTPTRRPGTGTRSSRTRSSRRWRSTRSRAAASARGARCRSGSCASTAGCRPPRGCRSRSGSRAARRRGSPTAPSR